ncbi:MAG: DUF1269 domain-containing protein [Tabrizicola sp.]|nr:DUF1269 domain-containing protein [Tabrizicola sp.]
MPRPIKECRPVSELMIAVFSSEAAATEARNALVALQLKAGTPPEDIVLVIRESAGEITLAQSVWKATGKPLGDGRWGTLIGSLFLDERDPRTLAGQGLAGMFSRNGLDDDFIRDVSGALVRGGAAVGMRLRSLPAKAVIERLSRLAEPGRLLRAKLDAETEADLAALRDLIPEYVPADERPEA